MDAQAEYMREGLATTQIAAEAAKQSADTSKLALELLERADVFVSEVFTDPSISMSSHVTLKLKNFGRTTAERVTVTTSLSIPRPPNSNEVILPGKRSEPFALAPGDVIMMKLGPITIWKATIDEVNRGAPLLLGIDIFYNDIFGTVHATTGEGKFIPTDGRFSLKLLTHN
jgi:hypothetical protein